MELTKYEHARILGARALQLSNGAPPMVEAGEKVSFLEVAEREFDGNVIPLAVLRKN